MKNRLRWPEKIIYQHWIYFKAEDGLRRFLCYDGADRNRGHCLERKNRDHVRERYYRRVEDKS